VVVDSRVYQSRIVGYTETPARELMPNPRNWREHPAMQRAVLAGVLAEVGWVQNIVVNRRTGRMIDGHLRVEIAAAKGESVPVTEVDLSEEEEAYILATLDPITGLAVTNEQALQSLLADVTTHDDAVRDLIAQLRGEHVDPFGDLVGDSDIPDGQLAFEIVVTVTTPDERDRCVSAIRAAGFTATISAAR